MLQIKENINLENLKKIGFVYEDGYYMWRDRLEWEYIEICELTRRIKVSGDEEASELMFDLIKANIIEKEQERRRILY